MIDWSEALKRIPLLSKKPLCEFTPDEFREYVETLYFKRSPRKSAAKKKKERDKKVTVKVLKKGGISLTTRRDPKYLTNEEIKEAAKATGRGINEIWIAAKEKGFEVRSHEEAKEIREAIEAIPF